VAFCSKALGRPVKWVEDRRENYLVTAHGRDHITDVELAVKRYGTLLALRGRTYANLGAYLSTAAPGIPTILHGLMLSGCYQLPAVDYEVLGVFTNTTPVDAYRGAGRPEATYIVERLMDLAAQELEIDPIEIRRRNFIPKDKFPYTTSTGVSYDSGDYEQALDMAMQMLDYPALRQQQRRAPREGSVHRDRCQFLRGTLRDWTIAGGWSVRIPGRIVGQCGDPRSSHRKSQRVHR